MPISAQKICSGAPLLVKIRFEHQGDQGIGDRREPIPFVFKYRLWVTNIY